MGIVEIAILGFRLGVAGSFFPHVSCTLEYSSTSITLVSFVSCLSLLKDVSTSVRVCFTDYL